MEKKEISTTTMSLMVGVALFYDVVQLIFNLIPVAGIIIEKFVIFPFAFLTFYVWFKIYGRSFLTPKRALAMGAGVIIELIPLLSILPGWTVAVIFLIGIEKAEQLAHHAGIKTLERVVNVADKFHGGRGGFTVPKQSGKVVGNIGPQEEEREAA